MRIIINSTPYWIIDLTNLKIHDSVIGICWCDGIRVIMCPGCTVSFDKGIEQGDLVEFCNEHGYGTGELYEIDNLDRLTMVIEQIKTRFCLAQMEQ